jgi:hypothetical protein
VLRRGDRLVVLADNGKRSDKRGASSRRPASEDCLKAGASVTHMHFHLLAQASPRGSSGVTSQTASTLATILAGWSIAQVTAWYQALESAVLATC